MPDMASMETAKATVYWNLDSSPTMKALCWSLLCLLTVAACSGRAPKATDAGEETSPWVCEAASNQEDWACRRENAPPGQ